MPKIDHRKNLTDTRLKSLKPAEPGQCYQVMDSQVPAFGIRVTDTGARTFIYRTRFPGCASASRRALGEVGVMSLADARDKARAWRLMVKQGIDPAAVEERARAEALTKRQTTFASVAEAFIAGKLPSERRGREVARDIRSQFIPLWGDRPITEITDLDVLALVKAKGRTAPVQARNLLGIIKRVFTWAIDQRTYGLKTSPADGLKASKIIGEKSRGDRVLSDDELFALWRAAKRTRYPYGPIYQMLIRTALRLNEVADASWSEVDLADYVWTIPAARMKGLNHKARSHAVPLIPEILEILQKLPRHNKGPCLFSATSGESPVWMTSTLKKRIDERMLRTLRALARCRGEDPSRVALPPWTNHDIRRTVRSHLSRLKIPEESREAVLAHVRPGIKGVYDQHLYLDEKREALSLWAAQLSAILEKVSAKLTRLHSRT